MSKNIFMKDKNYKIVINKNEHFYSLNTKNNKIEIDLKESINKVEISIKDFKKSYEISSKNNDVKVFNIHPNITYELALGILLGFSFVASIVILFLSSTKGVNLLLIFITFIPLLFLKRKNFCDDYELKEVNQ